MSRKKKNNKIDFKFIPMPRHILESSEYASLKSYAVKLLIDLYAQYRGGNNGDFSAAWKIMEKRGWRSRDTLGKALKELVQKGFIELTRQGWTHRCSLYAVTWLPIHACDGKLDVSETKTASNKWKKS